MRKWGIVITVCYGLILLGLILPMAVFIVGPRYNASLSQRIFDTLNDFVVLIPMGIFLLGQALLLFLSVDTSFKRLKPRAHTLVSCTVAALLMATLAAAGVWSLSFGVLGDKFLDTYFAGDKPSLVFGGALWLFWGILFYFYFRNSSTLLTRLISWLLKGSVLELLIAVPCHILVRRRQDCSAPIVTSFGVATGLAIMLLSFGPSVLFLYKKRLDAYHPPRPSA
jgi:hypothetical protein